MIVIVVYNVLAQFQFHYIPIVLKKGTNGIVFCQENDVLSKSVCGILFRFFNVRGSINFFCYLLIELSLQKVV
jgi:hypothetical protein